MHVTLASAGLLALHHDPMKWVFGLPRPDTSAMPSPSAQSRRPQACNLAPTTAKCLLDGIERAAFGYFRQTVNPANGLVADTSRENSPSSIAVVGFALSAYPVAVERGWMSRAEAVELSLAALRFFRDSDQSGSAGCDRLQGVSTTTSSTCTSGVRVWRSELSMIDTALLIAGALTARMYFNARNRARKPSCANSPMTLYRRVDWRWAQDGGRTIRQGWKPECGFLHYGWEGYSESIVLYVLALGSPTHPLEADTLRGWTATYQWENLYGYDFLYAGPLFVHQFSHAWIDFRGIRDRFMREKRCDYFENSRRAIARPARVRATQPARVRRATTKTAGASPPAMARATRLPEPADERRRCSAMPRVACRTARMTEPSPDGRRWRRCRSRPRSRCRAARDMYRRYPEMRARASVREQFQSDADRRRRQMPGFRPATSASTRAS